MTDTTVQRHIHLDPVGGIAGDMFVAAMLDTFPHLVDACWADLENCGVLEHVATTLQPGKSHGLAVKRFCVSLVGDSPRATGHYRDLKNYLEHSALADTVKARALELLELLASAESRVHGVALEDVHFHEVADWDSIADIVAAASLIEHSAVDSWSCGRLPTGSGLIKTEHGMLPVPAPATLALLEGLKTWDDGEPGERVTPTGAAIVRYLLDTAIESPQRRAQGEIACFGMGAGQRELTDRPNILRVSLTKVAGMQQVVSSENPVPFGLQSAAFTHDIDHVIQLDFAIDDMTSEELAVALQYVRQSDGVVDVSHSMSYGKKGRMVFDVTVLCSPSKEPNVSRLCFAETSTLGIRVQRIARRVLRRRERSITSGTGDAGIKFVRRPSASDKDQDTLKVDSDDLRRIPGLYARRRHARSLADATESDMGVDSSLEGN